MTSKLKSLLTAVGAIALIASMPVAHATGNGQGNPIYDTLHLNTPLGAASGGTGVNALGTGVPAALGVAIGAAGAAVLFNGAGGTPTSLVLTNATGLPNTGLLNSSVTIGSTNIALGATATTLAGLTSVTATTFIGALTGHASLDAPLASPSLTGELTIGNAAANGTTTASTTSSIFQALAGTLPTTVGDDINFGGFEASSGGNNSLLNFHLRRVTSTAGWNGTAMGLSYDVDGTVAAGGALWFYNGSVGIGNSTPAFSLDVTGTERVTGAITLGGALTYGGVTLGNSVTGAGSMVLSASPTLTGTPTAPTASLGTNTTQLATTAFVLANGVGHQQCPLIDNYGGSGNGSTSNNTAFASALAANVNANNLCVAFGAGNYAFASAVNVTIPANASLSLVGAGSGVTEISPAAAINFLNITYTNQSSSMHASGMSLLSPNSSGGNVAFVLSITTPSTNPALAAPSTFYDVIFRGADGFGVTDFWPYAVFSNNVSNINFISDGFYGGSSNGVGFEAASVSATPGVVYNFSQDTFEGLADGIVYGSYTQGYSISQSNFTAVPTAVYAPSGEFGLTQLNIANSQFGFSVINLQSSVGNLNITGNLFIIQASTSAINGIMVNAAIVGNNFSAFSTTSTLGVACLSGSSNNVITGNTFNADAVGVNMAAGCNNSNVQGNVYLSVGTKVVNSGTSNSVGLATD